MKRTILILIALLSAVCLNAQVRFGIKGGVNFNSMSDLKVEDFKASFNNRTGFNAGVLVQAKIPGIGLSFQPELLYTSKGGTMNGSSLMNDEMVNMRMDYLQLPVNIQWGIDLLLFRPYIEVSPYVAYAVGKFNDIKNMEWDNFNRFDYGIGVGIGVEIWKFQISGRYSWSLGKLADFRDIEGIGDYLDKNVKGAKLRGFELSLAFLF